MRGHLHARRTLLTFNASRRHGENTLLDQPTASRLAADDSFVWHQSFELGSGVRAPGVSNVDFLFSEAEVPADLTGASVLDIGTTNGGAAFEAERRGAERVVAVDIEPPSWYGFDKLSAALGSRAEYLRSSVYELEAALGGERFDVVLFWGVLYHLRHPILALDNLRAVTAGTAYVETAVADHELPPDLRSGDLSRFYRRDELAGDASNWFAPTTALLGQWLTSCGLEPIRLRGWPEDAPTRAHATCAVVPGEPEWMDLSYERRLRVSVDLG